MRKIELNFPLKTLAPLVIFAFLGVASQTELSSSFADELSEWGSILKNKISSLFSNLPPAKNLWAALFDQDDSYESDSLTLSQSGRKHDDLQRYYRHSSSRHKFSSNRTDEQTVHRHAQDETVQFRLSYYYHSLSVMKKNYLDSGKRSSLSHRSPKESLAPVANIEFSAWENDSALQKMIDSECGIDTKCKENFKTVALSDLSGFPYPVTELKGFKPVFDKETQTYICPEFKRAEYTHLNPMIQLVAMGQVFGGEELKEASLKIWLPLQILDRPPHIEKGQYIWDEIALDSNQGSIFHSTLLNSQEMICLPHSAEGEVLGAVGGSCYEDSECLSGCCQNGACAAHNPKENIFCQKEAKESCLSHEYCQYEDNATLIGGTYRNKKCQISNSFKGRAHNLCVNHKCVSDSGRIVNIIYKRDLRKEECRGIDIPAPDQITLFKLDSTRQFIMRDNIPLTETVPFEK